MVIFVSTNSGIHSSDMIEWKDELEMQDFILQKPEAVFSEFFEESVRICPIGKELSNENGRADFIFLSEYADLFIIETKLDSNNDKRDIFSQVKGYASAIRNQCTFQTFDDFLKDCEKSIESNQLDEVAHNLGNSVVFKEYLNRQFKSSVEETNKILAALKKNIKENSNVFCVIVMDHISNSFKRDIDYYIADKSHIFGVELQKYIQNNSQIIVPLYYGLEKLLLEETYSSEWQEQHEKGWNTFNENIKSNSELDDKTKNTILKFTAALGNMHGTEGWLKISNNTLKIYFENAGFSNKSTLYIAENGELIIYLNAFRDNPEISSNFKNQLSKIDNSIKKNINRELTLHVKPEIWIPKVDEFIAVFEKVCS